MSTVIRKEIRLKEKAHCLAQSSPQPTVVILSLLANKTIPFQILLNILKSLQSKGCTHLKSPSIEKHLINDF